MLQSRTHRQHIQPDFAENMFNGHTHTRTLYANVFTLLFSTRQRVYFSGHMQIKWCSFAFNEFSEKEICVQ